MESSTKLIEAVEYAYKNLASNNVPSSLLQMVGMSGRSYRRFINLLIKTVEDPRYLEVGSWAGSTLCSAILGNTCRALAIDNWSEFGGPAQAFFGNVANSVTDGNPSVSILSMDFRKAPIAAFAPFNVYLYDGPHTEEEHYDGLRLAVAAMDDSFVFIVDDWNWDGVRAGTMRAIEACGLKVLHKIEIRTTDDGRHVSEHGLPGNQDSDWHNGYFISVLSK